MAEKAGHQQRTLDQRIAQKELELKRKQDELRKLKRRAADEERRARTRRLVEVGAVAEKALGMTLETEAERKAFYDALVRVHRPANGNPWTRAASIASDIRAAQKTTAQPQRAAQKPQVPTQQKVQTQQRPKA